MGAGPAGATAAIVLARAGVHVTLLDRARFPRHKLCGDTLNPGALRALRDLGLEDATRGALPLEGMRLTGPGGARVEARYPPGVTGAAITRRDFDQQLLALAERAGANIEEQVAVHGPFVEGTGDHIEVKGVLARSRASRTSHRCAPVTIAADGHASRLVSSLRLARRPDSPRRWAIGAYYEGVEGVGPVGEMHLRRGHYIGVAPLPGGLTNAILVVPRAAVRGSALPFAALLQAALERDEVLAPRFAGARCVTVPVILGPLAVDVPGMPPPGLLLAGDAAGFIDPMTGDGMRFAIAGGVLAAKAALRAVEHGWDGVGEALARDRRSAFRRKWRFNRALRRVSASPLAVACAARLAPLAGPVLKRVVWYAGDA